MDACYENLGGCAEEAMSALVGDEAVVATSLSPPGAEVASPHQEDDVFTGKVFRRCEVQERSLRIHVSMSLVGWTCA